MSSLSLGPAAVLSIEEARLAVGLETDDDQFDDQLGPYNDAAGGWISDVTDQPAVSAELVALDENPEPSNVLAHSGGDTAAVDLAAVAASHWLVSVGTSGDPVSTAGARVLTETSSTSVTVTGDPVAVPTDGLLFVGRWATEADVPEDLKAAAKAYLGWLWRVEVGVASDGFDSQIGVSFDVPVRIFNMLPGRFAPGVA